MENKTQGGHLKIDLFNGLSDEVNKMLKKHSFTIHTENVNYDYVAVDDVKKVCLALKNELVVLEKKLTEKDESGKELLCEIFRCIVLETIDDFNADIRIIENRLKYLSDDKKSQYQTEVSRL